MAYIKEIQISNVWGFKNICWENVNEDVNIIVGINGSGKSTLLNILNSILSADSKSLKMHKGLFYKLLASDSLQLESGVIDSVPNLMSEYISTFDNAPKDSRKKGSFLNIELQDTIYATGQGGGSFYDYRLKATNFPKQAVTINKRIQTLYNLINEQFSSTNKKITIDVNANKIIFRQDEQIIQLEDLSSGEKQFLLIIFKVFLMEEQPYILIMDEPEISLHIDWQYELINVIQKLNPNCQLFISTHSPSIFGDGWGDKVVYMEDILK